MFVEQRLLDCVTYGTMGGPSWVTRKVGLRSGIVRRNPMRTRPQYRFQVLYRNLRQEHHAEVLRAFNACMGCAIGFRIKDWSDYAARNEFIAMGTGAEQVVQLAKVYAFGDRAISRPIRKPVAGTVLVTADGAALPAAVNYSTGAVTFTAELGDVVRWSGEFDVPVCFSDDELGFSIDDQSPQGGYFLTADVSLEEDLSA